MKLHAPLQTLARALADRRGQALPAGSGRWYVLFTGGQRPLLMPAGPYGFQKKCLRYFVADRARAVWARALLKANAVLPAAGLLREFRLPQADRSAFHCELSIRRPSHVAVQIGTTGPYQKASLLLLSERGEGLALAKLALAASADQMVKIEADWLGDLAGIPELAAHVPQLLAEGWTVNGRRYLVTSLAPSTAVTRDFTPAHAEFLGKLGRSRLETMGFEESPCFQRLKSTLARLEPHVTRDVLAVLQAALGDCRTSLSGWAGPFVIAQGDFAPWNIRVHERGIFVFDWEYAQAGANPLADAFSYFMIRRATSGWKFGKQFLVTVMRRVEAYARDFYPEWNWRPRVISALALAYLLDVLARYCWSRQAVDWAHPAIRSYWQLVGERREWLATA
jgi:hypothetical protein